MLSPNPGGTGGPSEGENMHGSLTESGGGGGGAQGDQLNTTYGH